MSKRYKWFRVALMVLCLFACGIVQADPIQTKFVTEGVAAKMNGARPHPLDMRPETQDGIKKMPPGVAMPLYADLKQGPPESPTHFLVVMDGASKGEPRIWIDANANGDLTDDPPIKWDKSTYPSFDGSPLALYKGSVVLQVRYGAETVPLRLSLLRYDVNDPNRDLYRNTLLYLADYAREVEIPLGPHTYHATLYDSFSSGDFRGKHDPLNSGIVLYIDVNGNGEYDARGEIYDACQPFTIKGVTYELANMKPDGSAFEVVKSKKTVPEIPAPPDLRVGQPILPFAKKRLDGQTVHFPADYKGKLVLLYFWASYCGVCQAQVPYVRDAYKQFHAKGLDILGVSVDPSLEGIEAAHGIPFPKYVEDSHILWPQIYEGKFWQGDLVQLYFLSTIPSPFLVDGNTGKILAVGDDLKGTHLAETLQKVLNTRKVK